MNRARLLPWVSLAALIASCQPAGEGILRAQWRSLDTALGSGSVQLPLRGTWCAMRGRLTLLAVSGDTGVGILARTIKPAPGLFPVSGTTAARSTGSTIAFRLATKSTLFTLTGDSGAVAITSTSDGKLAGRFVGWFAHVASGPVLLTGSFENVTAVPDTMHCDYDAPSLPSTSAPTPDSSVP